ncbi:MAG: alpha/beta hydrolase [Salibacteraceae bacterium]
MKQYFLLSLTCFLLLCCQNASRPPFEKLSFPSQDGLIITADWFEKDPAKPAILLCHQAGYSRGEYRKTARELNEAGYNCLAIDQRSGDGVTGIINETATRAREKGLPNSYLDAEPDIRAAIDYLHARTGQKIILWGSSYSASLALKVAVGNDKVSKVVAFSPGEYLKGVKLSQEIGDLAKPTFVTSSAKEANDVRKLMKGVKPKYVTQFAP